MDPAGRIYGDLHGATKTSRSLPVLTILWDNDGVLVDTEGLYVRATQEVLRTVGIHLTAKQFKEISLRRGESTFVLAVERGVTDDEIARLRAERDRRYAELLGSQSWAIDGAEGVLRSRHGQVRMGVVTSARRVHFETAHWILPRNETHIDFHNASQRHVKGPVVLRREVQPGVFQVPCRDESSILPAPT